ncbi:MAG: hypothetical protein AAGJ70_00550 [Pseudomonadota bacterium]
MYRELRNGQQRLESTTKVTLAVLALASGVYTYLGVRGLLDGTATLVFFGAIIYSAAVSVGIYAFWSYLMRFMPHVRFAGSRRLLYVAMAIGSAMIIAMSSWLNAAALAGSAALEQHLANATEEYQQKLDQANSNALAAQGLKPDIQLASQRFADLARQEERSGALTGTSGSGTVVQLLRQMSGQLNNLLENVSASEAQVKSLFDEGRKNLARMRKLVSGSGPIDGRSNAFAEEVVQLTGVIAALQQSSVAPAVKRTAVDLGRSFIAPAADGGNADLVSRQNAVVKGVEQAVRNQSAALAAAADEILAQPEVTQLKFTPLSTAEAVLLYAKDFLPSWAGAISIDLLPAVMIFIMIVVQSAIRREQGSELDENVMSAGDVLRAMKLYQAMGLEQSQGRAIAAEMEELRRREARGEPNAIADPERGPRRRKPEREARDVTDDDDGKVTPLAANADRTS